MTRLGAGQFSAVECVRSFNHYEPALLRLQAFFDVDEAGMQGSRGYTEWVSCETTMTWIGVLAQTSQIKWLIPVLIVSGTYQ